MRKPAPVRAPKRRRNLEDAARVGFLALMGLLLFARLGHYAIWDDEAMIALVGEGVLKTGDTSVVLDHNLVAYRGGLLVRELHDRSTPPLSAYLAAASMGMFGKNALAVRLPFALFGLAAVAMGAWWLRRIKAGPLTQAVAALAVLGNVSFVLYSRQSRYHAPTVFLSMAVVFAYFAWRGEKRTLLAMALLSVSLFAANYMVCAALYGCLAIDYVLWRRHERRRWQDGWWLVVPLALGCGLIASIWNPLRTQFGGYAATSTLGDRLQLFYWNWRDMNRCEFLVGGLLLLAIFVAWTRKDQWLFRALVALGVFVAAITCVSPQTMAGASVADVRYLVPAIPLCIAIEVRTILLLCGHQPPLALVLAVVAFGTNLIHGGPLLASGLSSTLLRYSGELVSPPTDPYTPAAKWINDHVRPGESIWVSPDYMTYPLMFHAPKAVYAWQLAWPPPQQFRGLPMIHFQGQEPPDYLIAFGPVVGQVVQSINGWKKPGLKYEHVETIDTYWKDLYRPELFWRSFKSVTNYQKNAEAIYIFKRKVEPSRPPP